jgi:hypothetical protein
VRKWNRSHCLNIGIRCASTPYVLLSDVDVIFPPTFLTTALQRLRSRPLVVIKSTLCNMPQETESLELPTDPEAYRASITRSLSQTQVRDAGGHCSILLLERRIILSLGGLDEFYEGWGFEDLDLYERLMGYGVEFCNISEAAPLLHQWHPRYDGVKDSALEETMERNRRYFQTTTTLVRNRGGWGAFGPGGALFCSDALPEPPKPFDSPGDRGRATREGGTMAIGLRAMCWMTRSFRWLPGRWRLVRLLKSRGDEIARLGPRVVRIWAGQRVRVDPADFVSRHILIAGDYEAATTDLFRKLLRPGDSAIDAGANIGYFSLVASRLVGPTGRVYAFDASGRIHLMARRDRLEQPELPLEFSRTCTSALDTVRGQGYPMPTVSLTACSGSCPTGLVDASRAQP